MKTKLTLSIVILALLPLLALGQTALTQTTLSAATTSSATTVRVASATGITANSTFLFVDSELMSVSSVSGTLIGVVRGSNGTIATAHASAAVVWAGAGNVFQGYDPSGSCTAASTNFPTINVKTGEFWRCDSTLGVWAPLFSTGAITPVATPAAIGTTAQTFTVAGLISGEPVVIVAQPAPTSLCPLVGIRVTAANTVSLYWTTLTAVACTPAAGTYLFLPARFH